MCLACLSLVDFEDRHGRVQHPAHYGGSDDPYEAIKVIEAWGLGFCLGNVLKYIRRADEQRSEKELEDLRKARWYLNREIQRREEEHAQVQRSESELERNVYVPDTEKREPELPGPRAGSGTSRKTSVPNWKEAGGSLYSVETVYPASWRGGTGVPFSDRSEKKSDTQETRPTAPEERWYQALPESLQQRVRELIWEWEEVEKHHASKPEPKND